jgi:predicted transcriptional regulator
MMKCEKMAKQLPGIRASVARELKKQGMTQAAISKSMGVTQGAVCQYLNRQRGFKSNSELEPLIKELCSKITRDRYNIEKEYCEICKKLEGI